VTATDTHLVADCLALLGCSGSEYHRACAYGDDFAAAWDGCESGSFLAWLLRRVDFPWERVSGVVYDLIPTDHNARLWLKNDTGGFETPESAHNLVVFFCRYLGDREWQRCACEADRDMAGAFREAFAFDEVRDAVLRHMSKDQ
jgi:hypothetical protein